jgi:site-specific DNA recombinase
MVPLYGPDGAAFSPTHTRKGGKLYRYYVSHTVLKHGAGTCPVSRVPAGEIEAAVIDCPSSEFLGQLAA